MQNFEANEGSDRLCWPAADSALRGPEDYPRRPSETDPAQLEKTSSTPCGGCRAPGDDRRFEGAVICPQPDLRLHDPALHPIGQSGRRRADQLGGGGPARHWPLS